MIRRNTGIVLCAFVRLATAHPCMADEASDNLSRWWGDLASADGMRAYRAIGALAARPQEAVPFLNEHLRPVVAGPRQPVAQLIASLGSERYAEREDARRALEKLEDLAEEELRKARVGRSTLEVRLRIDRLLERLDPLKSPERLRVLRALEVLEGIGSPEAMGILSRLARGVPAALQTREARASLDRLAKRPGPPRAEPAVSPE